jgi:DUF4097 and DUF4098 domain-containing protein YvlB
MHRLGEASPLGVSHDGNVVRFNGGDRFGNPGDVTIQVPTQTNVTIRSSLGGKIVVENVAGDIEVSQLNGDITINNASGPVVAHAINGKIAASMSRLAMNKSMSFSTFDGDIDLTLPADNGDIFTDFDVRDVRLGQATSPQPPPPPPPPASSSTRDQVRNQVREQVRAAVKTARKQYGRTGSVEGTINGGGTEIQFTTFNGRILIHKR